MGLLADGELRFGDDAGETGFDRLDLVVMVAAQLVERRPALPLRSNVLPLIGADEAGVGRRAGRRKLSAAGHADRMHHAPSSETSVNSQLWPCECSHGEPSIE